MPELNRQQFPSRGRSYFHVAPESSVSDIETHGLDYSRGQSAYHGLDFPRGNYMFTRVEAAQAYRDVREREEADEYGQDAERFHVFEVRPGHRLQPDPFHDDPSGLGKFSRYTPKPVPPHRIRRLA